MCGCIFGLGALGLFAMGIMSLFGGAVGPGLAFVILSVVCLFIGGLFAD